MNTPQFRKIILLFLVSFLSFCGCEKKEDEEATKEESEEIMRIEKIPSLKEGQWQTSASFPERKGYTDDTLAMNSILPFQMYEGQGWISLKVKEGVSSFDLFVNAKQIEGDFEEGSTYRIDISDLTVNGTNLLQVSSIEAKEYEDAVEVFVPYPELIEGDLLSEGFHEEALTLVSDIIQSDVDHGFPGAQLAIIRHGKLVCNRTWGYLSAYEQDGTRKKDPLPADDDTMYDLASVTKMFSANYALQKLVSEGRVSIDDRVCDYLGDRFYEDTLDFSYDFGEDVSIETQQEWKSQITIRDLVCHMAGFPPAPRYFNIFIDAPSQEYLKDEGDNVLFSGSEPSSETRERTLEAICQTPLLRKPGTKYQYSDVDYMILCFLIEEVSGMGLDEYMKENFFEPLDLQRITFDPLKHGYTKEDCAATELRGNTRDGVIDFPGIRTYTLQGEVHDEMAYYSMNGVSGHAGLFANAKDLAKLAYVMLKGGYGNHRFFTRNVIDVFAAPQSIENANTGLGWARQGDDQKPWYFATSSSATIGHQGWTGTLVMIDPEKDIVIVFLTNERNTPLPDPEGNANDFAGLYYTSSTLGFVSQLLYLGLDEEVDITPSLKSLCASMVKDAEKLIVEGSSDDHPSRLNYDAKLSILEKYQ